MAKRLAYVAHESSSACGLPSRAGGVLSSRTVRNVRQETVLPSPSRQVCDGWVVLVLSIYGRDGAARRVAARALRRVDGRTRRARPHAWVLHPPRHAWPQLAPLLSAAWHRWSEAGCWPAVRGTWRPVASAAGRGHGARPPRRLGECTDEGGRGVGSRIADTPSGSRTHVTTIADAEHTHTWLTMAGGTTTHP